MFSQGFHIRTIFYNDVYMCVSIFEIYSSKENYKICIPRYR